MRILGIDPGLTRCGVGIVKLSANREITFEHVEVLRSDAKDPLEERVFQLGESISRILSSGEIGAVAIERVFVGENLPSVMGVAQITGVVLYLAKKNAIPVTFYAPNEVKSNITGYGAADKTQVTNMVMKALNLKTAPKPADAADSLAIAVVHARSLRGIGLNDKKPILNPELTPARNAWLEAEKKAKNRTLRWL